MNDEDVWCRRNHTTFLKINLAVATTTLVVADDLSFNLLREGFFNRLESFDRDGQVKVVFHAVLDLSTLSADHLTALFSSEDALDEMLASGFL